MAEQGEYKWKVITFIGIIFLLGVAVIIASINCPETNIWNKILLSVGSSLIGGALLVILTEYFFKKDISSAITKEIADEFFSNRNEIINSITAIHKRRPDLISLISSSKDCIDICITKLQSIDLEKDEIKKAYKANPNLKIRLLVMNYRNDFVKNHPVANGYTENFQQYRQGCVNSLTAYLNMKAALDREGIKTNNFEIRCYSCSPTIRIFRFDNKMIVGFLWKQGRPNNLYHIELKSDCALAQCFQTHFNDLFSSSTEPTVESLTPKKDKDKSS